MKPIVKVKGSDETGYSVSIDNATHGVDRRKYAHHLCEMIRNQSELIDYRNNTIQDLQVEIADLRKQLKKIKRTFVEARALHDLRNHVLLLLTTERYGKYVHPDLKLVFDTSMRHFIKQYQDRVEAWPADAAKHPYEQMTERLSGCSYERAPEKKQQLPRVRYFRFSHQIPNERRQVGYLNHNVSKDEFIVRVTNWKNICTQQGYDLAMVIAWDNYHFYQVPKHEH